MNFNYFLIFFLRSLCFLHVVGETYCVNQSVRTIRRNDLRKHQLLWFVTLSVHRTGQPFNLFAFTVRTPRIAARCALLRALPVAVYAYHESTFMTHPVHVEQGGFTHVAHLPYSLYSTFPSHFCWK